LLFQDETARNPPNNFKKNSCAKIGPPPSNRFGDTAQESRAINPAASRPLFWMCEARVIETAMTAPANRTTKNQ
jgi:hypothetical protein